jgi:Protein of unknown function (DUF 659)/hAT family C-terminal dimerisation region
MSTDQQSVNVPDADDDGPSTEIAVDRHSKKRGPPSSEIWLMFTDAVRPQLTKSSMCKHCKTQFSHHRKSEVAKLHLVNCYPFRQLMDGKENADRPDWYDNKKPARQVKPPTVFGNLPPMSESEKESFQQKIALFFYATGTSFERVENVYLWEAIRMLRPDDNLLPNRRELASTLLDKCHSGLLAKVDKRMSGATTCLTTDAWSNVSNDPIVNYMAVSPSCTLFLESVSTGQQGHDAEFIAKDIIRVIQGNDKTTFAGAVTDNTSANKKAWKILKETFPSSYFQGCCAHGLHLLVKDVFGATKTRKAGSDTPTYPDGYRFEALQVFVDGCKDVVKFFHNHHVPKAQLQSLQKTTGARALARAAPTRWGTVQAMVQSLLDSECHLREVVTARDFIQGTALQRKERTNVYATVTGEGFVESLKKSLAILCPIDRLIVKYQSDKVPISEVTSDFNGLPVEFGKLLHDNVITDEEQVCLCALARRRYDFMYGQAYGLSYLLDPRFLGEKLSWQTRRDLEHLLVNTPADDTTPVDDRRKELVSLEYANFKIAAEKERERNSPQFRALTKREMTPLQWWLADGSDHPLLKPIATKLFSMVTSTAASERNFSTMGFVHSKLRNRLAPQRVEKLVFLKSNLTAFDNYAEPEVAGNAHAADAEE